MTKDHFRKGVVLFLSKKKKKERIVGEMNQHVNEKK